MTKFLFDWDSIDFALAFGNYNIALHQPQPPGYILYVALGKMVNFIFNDPNFTMILINIIFSVLTVVLIYLLAKKMFSRTTALIASILLIFNPIFWFYGEIAAIYINEALFATLIAYTSYQLLEGDNKFLYISAIILGLSGGFRQDLIVFMFPLWLFCLLYQNTDYKRITKAFMVLIASAMIWFVPTIILAGGYGNYSVLTRNLLTGFFSVNSVLFGANVMKNIVMDLKVLYWSIIGIGISGAFILIIFAFYKLKSINLPPFKNSKSIFLTLWMIPALIFYLLVFFAKPGYILIYLPVLVLIMAYVILDFSSDLNKKFSRIPKNYFIILLLSLCLISGIMHFVYPLESGINYMRIQAEDTGYQNIYNSIKEFSPQDTLIFVDNEINWKKTIYYFPDYQIYSYIPFGNSIKSLLYYKKGGNTSSDSNSEIRINSSTTKILWITDENSEILKELKSEIEIKTLVLPNGHSVYYSDVNKKTNFEIYNFTFKGEDIQNKLR